MPAPTAAPEGISVALTSVGAGGLVGSQEGPGSPRLMQPHPSKPAPGAPGPLVLLRVGLQARSSESTRCGALRGRCVSLGWHKLNVITDQEAHSCLHLRHQPCPTRHAPGHPHLVHKCPPVSCPCSPSPAFPHPLGGSAAKTFLRSPQAPSHRAEVGRVSPQPGDGGVAITRSIRTPPPAPAPRRNTTARKQVLVLGERPRQGGCEGQRRDTECLGRTTQTAGNREGSFIQMQAPL